MLCAICESLQREHGRACEEEAKAILEQNRPLFQEGDGPVTAPDQNLQDVILGTRRRQLKIATELNEHRSRAHAAVA